MGGQGVGSKSKGKGKGKGAGSKSKSKGNSTHKCDRKGTEFWQEDLPFEWSVWSPYTATDFGLVAWQELKYSRSG